MEAFYEYLVFSPDYSSQIAFVSTKDVQKSFSISVDWSVPLNSAKPKLFLSNTGGDNDEDESEKKENENGKSESEESGKSLINIAVAEATNLLAYTAGDKSLFISKIEGKSARGLSRRRFLRSSSCIRFSRCGQLLYLADKTGDVFEYPCDEEKVNLRGRWILGQISQILDLQVTPSFIVTSDRDEKIRVNNRPKVHEIHSYCLGHKEFVSAMSIISDSQIFSISGDKSLKLWNYVEGKELGSCSLSFVPVLLKVIAEDMHTGLVCASSLTHTVHVYRFTITDSNLQLDELGEKAYASDVELAVLGESFYIKHIQQDESPAKQEIAIDTVVVQDNSVSFQKIFDSSRLSAADTSVKIIKPFDVDLLFKSGRTHDNVKQYIDRKKARIEKSNK